jgi:RNA polymerase-binding transcription factor DksA
MDEAATTSEDYDTVLGEAERVLGEVDRALARLDEGTYGTCEVCGGPITEDRLTTDPTAVTCEQHLRLSIPPPESAA